MQEKLDPHSIYQNILRALIRVNCFRVIKVIGLTIL